MRITFAVHYVYLAIAIVCEVVATTALKPAEGFTKPIPTLIVIVGYTCAFFLLSLTLRVIPVGIAYAIWSGVGVSLIAIAGWLFFNQKLDLAALAGIGLIMAGVVVINVFSRTVTP